MISGGGHLLKNNKRSMDLLSNPWQLTSEFFFPQKGDGVKKKNKDKVGGLVFVELGLTSGVFEYYKCDGTYLYSFDIETRML